MLAEAGESPPALFSRQGGLWVEEGSLTWLVVPIRFYYWLVDVLVTGCKEEGLADTARSWSAQAVTWEGLPVWVQGSSPRAEMTPRDTLLRPGKLGLGHSPSQQPGSQAQGSEGQAHPASRV